MKCCCRCRCGLSNDMSRRRQAPPLGQGPANNASLCAPSRRRWMKNPRQHWAEELKGHVNLQAGWKAWQWKEEESSLQSRHCLSGGIAAIANISPKFLYRRCKEGGQKGSPTTWYCFNNAVCVCVCAMLKRSLQPPALQPLPTPWGVSLFFLGCQRAEISNAGREHWQTPFNSPALVRCLTLICFILTHKKVCV